MVTCEIQGVENIRRNNSFPGVSVPHQTEYAVEVVKRRQYFQQEGGVAVAEHYEHYGTPQAQGGIKGIGSQKPIPDALQSLYDEVMQL